MAAALENIQVHRGADALRIWTWMSGDPPQPVDLSGCSARMQIRKRVQDDAALALLSSDNGLITLGGATGTIQASFTHALTAALPVGALVYDLAITHPDGQITLLIGGELMNKLTVTRE